MNLKQRLLSKWTFSRTLYLVVGGLLLLHSAMDQEWLGVALGGYFASMGLLAFGCAGGQCVRLPHEGLENQSPDTEDIDFEEVTEVPEKEMDIKAPKH